MKGEGCEGDDDSGGDNNNGGDSGDAQGSTGGEGGGVFHFSRSNSEEKRGGDGEVGVEAPQPFHLHISVCSISWQLIVDAGGHITASTGAGGGGWGGCASEPKLELGGRSVGTSKLDNTSNPIGGSTKGDGVDCHRLLNQPPLMVVVTRHEHQ